MNEDKQEYISKRVDHMIRFLDAPNPGGLVPLRWTDGIYPQDPEEYEAWRHWVHWCLHKDYETLNTLSGCVSRERFVPFLLPEFDTDLSVFVSRMKQPDPGYPHASGLSGIYAKLRDLAETHCVVQDMAGKRNVQKRFVRLVQAAFISRIDRIKLYLASGMTKPNKARALERLSELRQHVEAAKQIWRAHAYDEVRA